MKDIKMDIMRGLRVRHGLKWQGRRKTETDVNRKRIKAEGHGRVPARERKMETCRAV